MATCLRYPGKVVIVTGGTSGIGLATVREFVHQGAKVVFCSRASGAEKGQAIEKELQDSGCPGEACYLVCDVSCEADVKNLISATVERYGCLDCLVNNAAVAGPIGKIDDVSSEDFRRLLEINLVSCFLTSKYALPYLRETRGNIINMACLIGQIGMADGMPFISSKGALLAMTKALAIDESKYRVRVNSISASNIWTPLWEYYADHLPNPEERFQDARVSQLLGRFGTPEEVAMAALFLAADGTFCTGTDLVVNGGVNLGFGKKNQVETEADPRERWSSRDSPRLGRRLGVARQPDYAWHRPSMVSPPWPSPFQGPSCSHTWEGDWPCAPYHEWPTWTCHPRSHLAWSRYCSS